MLCSPLDSLNLLTILMDFVSFILIYKLLCAFLLINLFIFYVYCFMYLGNRQGQNAYLPIQIRNKAALSVFFFFFFKRDVVKQLVVYVFLVH